MSNIEISKDENLIVSVMLIVLCSYFKPNIIEYSLTSYYERVKNR